MADPRTPEQIRADVYYSESILKVRTRTGFRLVGTVDQPLFIRTRNGWREYPGPAVLNQRTRHGWRTIIT